MSRTARFSNDNSLPIFRRLRFEQMESRLALSGDATAALPPDPLAEQLAEMMEAGVEPQQIADTLFNDEKYDQEQVVRVLEIIQAAPLPPTAEVADTLDVTIRSEVIDASGATVSAFEVGQEYFLRVFVQDTRPLRRFDSDAGGVYQAHLDLLLSNNITLTGETTFADEFFAPRQGIQSIAPDGTTRIGQVGAKYASFEAPGRGEQFLLQTPFVVDSNAPSAAIEVVPSSATNEAILLFGQNDPISRDEIAPAVLEVPVSPPLIDDSQSVDSVVDPVVDPVIDPVIEPVINPAPIGPFLIDSVTVGVESGDHEADSPEVQLASLTPNSPADLLPEELRVEDLTPGDLPRSESARDDLRSDNLPSRDSGSDDSGQDDVGLDVVDSGDPRPSGFPFGNDSSAALPGTDRTRELLQPWFDLRHHDRSWDSIEVPDVDASTEREDDEEEEDGLVELDLPSAETRIPGKESDASNEAADKADEESPETDADAFFEQFWGETLSLDGRWVEPLLSEFRMRFRLFLLDTSFSQDSSWKRSDRSPVHASAGADRTIDLAEILRADRSPSERRAEQSSPSERRGEPIVDLQVDRSITGARGTGMTLEVAEPQFWNREQRPKADSETSPGATRDSWNVRDPEQDAS